MDAKSSNLSPSFYLLLRAQEEVKKRTVSSPEFTLEHATFRPEIWRVICQDAAETDMSTNVDEEPVLPVYQPPTRSHSQSTSLRSEMRIPLCLRIVSDGYHLRCSSSTRGDRSLDRGLPSGFPSLGSTLQSVFFHLPSNNIQLMAFHPTSSYPQSFLHMEPLETFTYAYNLVANDTQLHIFIL